MTFNATTHFQGTVLFDLVTPGNPGIGSDLIQIIGGQTGTIAVRRSVQLSHWRARPETSATSTKSSAETLHSIAALVTTDNDPNAAASFCARIRTSPVLALREPRTTPSSLGMRRSSNWRGITAETEYEVTFGRYLDQNFPQDDHTIGTANADLQWIRDTLDLMPNEANVVRALGQMSGEIYAPLAAVALQRQFFAYNQFAGRLRRDLFQPCAWINPNVKIERCARHGPLETPIEHWVPRGWVAGYGFGGSIAGTQTLMVARTAGAAFRSPTDIRSPSNWGSDSSTTSAHSA